MVQRFPPFCPFISLVGSPRHPPLPARADRSATCGSSGSPVRSALRAAGAAGWSSAGRAPGHPRRAAGCGADDVWQHRALSSAPAELRKFKKGTAAPRFFPASSHTPRRPEPMARACASLSLLQNQMALLRLIGTPAFLGTGIRRHGRRLAVRPGSLLLAPNF